MEALFYSIGLEIPLVVAVAAMLALAGMWLGRGAAPAAGAPTIALSGGRERVGPMAALVAAGGVVATIAARAIAQARAAMRRFGLEAVADGASTKISGRLGKQASGRRLVPAVQAAMPQRLSLDQQWSSAAGVVVAAVSGARAARTAHESAGEKLDAATYALERLMAELGGFARPKGATAEIAVLMRPTNPPTPFKPRDMAAA